MKYIAQPQFANKAVAIYAFSLSTTPVITLGPFADNPNSALIYQDSSGVTPAFYLLVALVNQTTNVGYVNIYNLDAIFTNGGSTQAPAALAKLTLHTDGPGDTTIQPIGMAIQPGTGDLWVATTNASNSYGTVNRFTRTAGASDSWAANGIPALTFNNSNAIAGVVSNLAFDLHGNLWLTTFDGGGNYLFCALAPVAAASQFIKFVNGPIGGAASLLPSTLLCPQLASLGFQPAPATAPALYPFSGSEGIAFDPAGNLWLGNNNDEYLDDVNPKNGGAGGGSLLMISGAWLKSLLYPTLTAQSGGLAVTTATTFNGTPPVTTFYVNDFSQIGGLCFDGYILYINDENNYGSIGAPVIWQVDTSYVAGPAGPDIPGLQGSFQWSKVTTTNPGNGSMSICNYPYLKPTLTIRDTVGDLGAQPDTAAGGVLWESPDILVSNSNVPPAGVTYLIPVPLSSNPSTPSFTGSGTVNTGSDAYLSIRVTNFGSGTSTGTEILKICYGFASTGLNWPAPWDGSQYSGNYPLGGAIGQMQLPSIPGNSEIYIQIVWPGNEIPNPANYLAAAGGVVAASEHFCLLARIESTSVYPFGMSHPEEVGTATALVDNATNNSAIGWRNNRDRACHRRRGHHLLLSVGRTGGKLRAGRPSNQLRHRDTESRRKGRAG
jgi:hypothetical protein